MKALTCEMCGSTNLIKEDGVFVCQSCGTKYSVEEAKKMMIDGTVSVKGTVTVDSSGLVDNYLVMASNASQAGNYAEAESYCNKIIEINPKHSRAWLLKGTAAGWQSTLANTRLEESYNCYNNAIEFSAQNEAQEIKELIIENVQSLSLAIVQLSCNHFSEFPSNDTSYSVTSKIDDVMLKFSSLIKSCGGDRDDLFKRIAGIVSNTATNTYQTLRTNYTAEVHPSEYDWKDYREGGDGCIWLIRSIVWMPEISISLGIRI